MCYAPSVPKFEEHYIDQIFDNIIPCAIITPLDCFWEGSKLLGPDFPVNIPGVGTKTRWTNLNPLKLVEEMKQFYFNFAFSTLEDYMKRVRQSAPGRAFKFMPMRPYVPRARPPGTCECMWGRGDAAACSPCWPCWPRPPTSRAVRRAGLPRPSPRPPPSPAARPACSLLRFKGVPADSVGRKDSSRPSRAAPLGPSLGLASCQFLP